MRVHVFEDLNLIRIKIIILIFQRYVPFSIDWQNFLFIADFQSRSQFRNSGIKIDSS